jgi:hypothetical protein
LRLDGDPATFHDDATGPSDGAPPHSGARWMVAFAICLAIMALACAI